MRTELLGLPSSGSQSTQRACSLQLGGPAVAFCLCAVPIHAAAQKRAMMRTPESLPSTAAQPPARISPPSLLSSEPYLHVLEAGQKLISLLLFSVFGPSLRPLCSDQTVLTANGSYISFKSPIDFPSLPHPLTFFVNDEGKNVNPLRRK